VLTLWHHPGVLLRLTDGPVPPRADLAASDLGSRQVRILLTRLALDSSRPVRTEVLADVLWPDGQPPSAATALRGIVAKARRWLDAGGVVDGLEHRPGAYALTLPEGWSTDLDSARRALLRADAAARHGDHRRAADEAASAIEWSSGTLLDGYDAEWIEPARFDLRVRLVDALTLRAASLSAIGDHRAAIATARRLVSTEPYGEAAHRALMNALIGAGDHGGAAQAYDALVRMLRDELGVAPSLETEALRASFDAETIIEPSGAPPRAPSHTLSHTRPGARAGARVTAFVGRSVETAALREAWSDAADGSRVVVVAGPAGIGKSALVTEFAGALASEGRVLTGRCSRTPAVPYEPLVEAIERDLRAQGPTSRASVLRAARPELGWAIPSLTPFVGEAAITGDPDVDRHRLFEAFTGHLRQLLATAPVLLVVDDAHWASDTTLLALRHVAGRLDRSPLLVVLVERRAVDAVRATGLRPDEWRPVPISELSVAGLDRDAVSELVTIHGDEGGGTAELDVDALVDRTGGNPYFVHEVLRASTEGTGGSLPHVVRDVIALHVEGASDDARALLRALAVLGDGAGLGVLREVAAFPADVFPTALDHAVATGLVELRADRGQLRFAHGLAREAVAAGTSPGRTMALHERAAQVLEAMRSRGGDVSVAELARHFAAAAPLGHSDRAVNYATEAARAELAAGASDDAASRLAAVVELDASRASRGEALLVLGSALAAGGDGLGARAAFVAAADVGEALGDGRLAAHAALGAMRGGRGVSSWTPGPENVELLDRALAVVDPQDAPLRIRLLGALADTVTGPRDWTRRQDLARQALAIAATSTDPDVVAAALGPTRVVAWRPEQAGERRRFADRVLVTGDADDHDRVLARADALLARACDSIVLGERQAAEQALAGIYAIADRHIRPSWEADLVAAGLAAADGRFDEARRVAVGAADRWGPGHPDARRALTEQLGLIATLDGGVAALVASELAGEVAALPDNATYRCAYPLVLAFQGRVEAAAAALDRIAAAGYEEVPEHINWGFAMAVLAEAAAMVGSPDRLRELHSMLEPSAGTFVLLHGPSMLWGAVDRVLGLMSARLSEWERAEAELRHALDMAEQFPTRVWVERGTGELQAVRRRAADRRD
jgi:DNA-binding SARP family transcriptional activator